jgi:hypothetical protein
VRSGTLPVALLVVSGTLSTTDQVISCQCSMNRARNLISLIEKMMLDMGKVSSLVLPDATGFLAPADLSALSQTSITAATLLASDTRRRYHGCKETHKYKKYLSLTSESITCSGSITELKIQFSPSSSTQLRIWRMLSPFGPIPIRS